MKKKKSKNKIEEIRKNSKWLKLFENVPYNNSKVGEIFIMKVSSRKTKLQKNLNIDSTKTSSFTTVYYVFRSTQKVSTFNKSQI